MAVVTPPERAAAASVTAAPGEDTCMCGRYAALLPAEALHRMFGMVNPPPNFSPTWNMAR
jgi:hypothetical protein